MKTETRGKINGIQWKIFKHLDDLDFADDLALMSHSHWQMQDKTTDLARISAQLGLKINKKKPRSWDLNTTCERPIMLEGEGLEEVESFRCLGSIVQVRATFFGRGPHQYFDRMSRATRPESFTTDYHLL